MLKRLSTITIVICAAAVIAISQSAYAQPEGLVLWNKLGSDEEVLNSAFGPDLEFYIGGGGIEVQGDREYLPGKFGNCVTLKGVYFNMARVHNLVLSNLSNVIDPEKGCIELWYYHTALPVGYSYNCYRLFDGIYGLGAGMGFDLYDYYYQPKKTLRFWLSFGAPGVPTLEYDANNIPVNQWVHLAASWDRDGINGSSETIRLYVNGAKVAWSTWNGWGNTVGSRADICGGNDRNIAGKFYMDNLKIWNYAKTNFSDRFAEIPVAIDIKGDVNGDGRVRSNDAILTLRIASQLIEPTAEQFQAADYNGDGRVRSNDAILILRVAAGLPVTAPGKDIIAGRNITITLGEAHGVAGESITLPVMVDNTHALAGGDISVSYDQTVLRALNVSSEPNTLMASNLSQPGTVRLAFANADKQIGKTVAKIQFHILADDLSPLTLSMTDLYGYDGLPLMSRGIDREFRSWAIPPEHSALLQNFPNPFNPETWIPYQLKNASEVTIQIYNVAGEMIRKLDLGYKSAGLYVSQDRAAYWDGRNEAGEQVASGVYFYTIQAGDFTATKKMVIAR